MPREKLKSEKRTENGTTARSKEVVKDAKDKGRKFAGDLKRVGKRLKKADDSPGDVSIGGDD
jgi:hypothetical protein